MTTYTIDCGGIPVAATVKRVQSMRLRITASGDVFLSVPVGTPQSAAEAFVFRQRDWLARYLAKIRQNPPPAREVSEGAARRVLGRDMTLHIINSAQKRVVRHGNEIEILTPSDDPAAWAAQYDAWFKREALSYFTATAERLFPLVGPLGAKPPEISVRQMRTRWGSCTPARGTIRFNTLLFEADAECVDAVVLHELAHLIFPNHGKQFYAFLEGAMPDYRARIARLKQTVRID